MNKSGPYWALAAICVLWGTTYGAIRMGMKSGFPPFLFSSFRYIAAGSMILTWYAAKKRIAFPSSADLRKLCVSALFLFVLGNAFLVMGQRTISGGIASLVNAGFPLWVVLITRIWNPSEKTPVLVLIGVLIGFSGQWIIFREHMGQHSAIATTSGLLFLLAGVINGTVGSVHLKKYPVSMDPVQAGAWQMLLSGIVMAFIGLFRNEHVDLPTEVKPWLALLYLVIAGSVLGYSLFVYALRYLPAQQVSVYAYVNPMIAILVGNLYMDEKISDTTLLAMLVIFAGVFLVNKGMKNAVPAKE